MEPLVTPLAGLASVAIAAFVAATLLPLASEVALFAFLKVHPDLFWTAIGVATLANTAGGMTTYLIGRFAGARKPLPQLEQVRRFGTPVLLFAWLPIVGDGFVLAAGWVRASWIAALVFQLIGRGARYAVIAAGT